MNLSGNIQHSTFNAGHSITVRPAALRRFCPTREFPIQNGSSTFRPLSSRNIIVVGGGAAGFFAAITCGETNPSATVTVLERGPQFLSKVRISGGGRCNVTHACFDAADLITRFPRGDRALLAPFQKFQARDTVEWFQTRGVKLKTEGDGRMFPASDSSQTIIDCLLRAARAADVNLRPGAGVERVRKLPDGRFEVGLEPSPNRRESELLFCDRLLLATGGCRAAAAGQLAVSLGHTLEPPVPSLFAFHAATPWLHELAGISVEQVEASVPSAGLRERGAVLITHAGLSGPVILRLSAWGARALHETNYRFALRVNWLPGLTAEAIAAGLQSRRETQAARRVVNTPLAPLAARLWEQLVLAAGISRETRWADLARSAQHQLVQQLIRTEFPIAGKTLNQDEFVTCGGVRLGEVDFKTMASRVCPGLYFAGELLDIDGITGGFNFQAAWTTGWLAGRAMAGKPMTNDE
jgi:predicted Rossmann fold flavoprotein